MPVLVESWTLYNLTLFAHLALFIAAPVWLFVRGWPILGGTVMTASTILPIAGQTWFTDSEAPGFGLLFLAEFPLALFVLTIGVVLSGFRLVKNWRLSKRPG